MKKLESLSIFFPFLNDEGTVSRQIHLAYSIGKRLTDNLQVIAIIGGKSRDRTASRIKEMKEIYPTLKIIDKSRNKEGYAVIKHGFNNANKKWIFYTDGDAQYHLETDLERLIEKQQKTNADVINGYKKSRRDAFVRVLLGNLYAKFSKTILQLPIRDVDCDFRLIRKSYISKINLESTDSTILPELIKKLQIAGASFAEIPVSHYPRIWGNSNYNIPDLIREKLLGDIRFFFELKKYK